MFIELKKTYNKTQNRVKFNNNLKFVGGHFIK